MKGKPSFHGWASHLFLPGRAGCKASFHGWATHAFLHGRVKGKPSFHGWASHGFLGGRAGSKANLVFMAGPAMFSCMGRLGQRQT